MRNLLNLLQKYSSVFFFLLLQAICFAMIFSNRNTYHHIAFTNSSNSVIGGIYEVSSNFSQYFHLKEENEMLLNENKELKKMLVGHSIKVGDLFTKVDDTTFIQQYDFIDGNVVNSSKNRRNNSLTINRGTSSNISEKMGVIGTKGVVGITVSSGPYYSTVIPIINEVFEMSVRHKSTKSFGILKWTENDTWKTATIDDIPNYVDLQVGDTIESRGSDGFFPEGVLIGTVLEYKPLEGTSYHRITIDLAEDFSAIYDVYVVKNILQKEQITIEENE